MTPNATRPVPGPSEALAMPVTVETTAFPDSIPVYDAAGGLVCWRPNYAKPGVREVVEFEAFDAECEAHPVRSDVGRFVRAQQMARLSRKFKI